MVASNRSRILARVLVCLLLSGIACSSHVQPMLQRESRDARERKVAGSSEEGRERGSELGEFQSDRRAANDAKPEPREHRAERAGSYDGDLRFLETLPVRKRERPEREGPELTPIPFPGTTPATPDQAQQLDPPVQPLGPAPASTSFDGLDFNNWGNGHPPDTNGDVGPTYFIQTVNTSIGIYNKSTGARLAAFTFDTLMSQAIFGNVCDTDNFGDPIALYDTFEDRWIITDFAFQLDGSNNVINPPGAYQCFAVSKTGDPVGGGWNFYSINTLGGLGDYPKLGIWPDGLYMSVNMFDYAAAGSFQNVRLYAFNKAQMYAGAPSIQVVSFDAPASQFTLLPANARLQTGTPPPGSPNYFASLGIWTNALEVFKFHVDWNSISTSTLTGPFTALTTELSQLSTAAPAGSVPSPANRLDTLYPRTMMQNQYSNFGGIESLWNSHTVGSAIGNPPPASAQASVRFYQVKVSGGNVEPNATQSFTYTPDGTMHRFLPSVAVNRVGDMAIGYSASNATTNPSIRYAGRLAADAANSITQTEAIMTSGTGSQSGNCGGSSCTRWGDYSTMTLDPNGCTFWFTTEYYATTGLNDLTRIGSFSFPSCSPVGTGTLQGTVKNGAVAIAGATVTLGSRTTTTDGSGNYMFTGLPAGTYPSATATAPGFSSATFTSIAVATGGTTIRNFVLSAAAQANCFSDTTQADFQTGVPTNCDLTGTPGSVTLAVSTTVNQQNLSVTNSGFLFTATNWAGQTFTPSATGQLTRIDLDLFCSGCAGTMPNITVSIRATSGSPLVPTGPDLATATIAGFTSGSGGYFTAAFASPATLTAGTRYAVIFRPVSPPSVGNYAYVCSCGNGPANTNPYANGQRVTSATSGGSWSADTTSGGRDLGFIAYMQTGFAASGDFVSSLKDANPVVGGSAVWNTIAWNATTPASTAVQFQVAASNSPNGPFDFVGPNGTAGTFFSNGGSLAQFNGKRYLKYKAVLTTSNSGVTPTITDVTVCFSNITTTGAATVTPGSVTFAGKRLVGTTSAPASPVTITNNGPNALVFTSFNGIAPSASFTTGTDFPTTTNCPLTPPGLASGGSCQFTFSFSPAAAGNRNATLTIVTNASNSPHAVSLSGVAFVIDSPTVTATLASGATRLSALQNADGGWYFLAADTSCGLGAGVSCHNLIGVDGLGLLSAYSRTNNATTLSDAVESGDLLTTFYNAAPTQPPFSQDLEFLRALSTASGNASYATTASSWFNAITAAFPVAADRVDFAFTRRDIQHRRSLAVWDLASLIRSAKAAGRVDYALAAATRIIAREADWKDTNVAHRWDQCETAGCGPADNPFAFDYTLLGEGSLLWAIHDLPGFDAKISEYRSFLLAQQEADGSWDVGDLQITAYAGLGLAAVGGTGVNTAITNAVALFIIAQQPSNGWPSTFLSNFVGSEYTNVDAEVMRAVAGLFSTQQGGQIQVRPAQLSTITFENVSDSGLTTVVALDRSSAARVLFGYTLVPGLTYEINTTAATSGDAAVCLDVPWDGVAAAFENVRVLHAEGGIYIDRTILSGPLAPDAAAKRVCASVSSLDAFAIALFDPNAVDTTAPELAVTLSPAVVAEAKQQMVTITATISSSDNADASPTITLVSITSNQALKNGDINGAAFGTDDRTFALRADQQGKDDRVYTVTYKATDKSGNSTNVATLVTVKK